jgi:hypothetical protein
MSAYVLFFGGYLATRTDINVWCGSAAAQKGDVTFDGYPWPAGASSDSDSAVTMFTKANSLDQAVATIEECAHDLAYLVGHSSGCAIANAVDDALAKRGRKDISKIILVALDGFAPSGKQLERPSTQVWVAEGRPKGVSRNHDRLIERLGSRVQIYKASNNDTKWGLHFSVVNSNATSKTTIENGYTNCRANLMWMP